MSRSRNGKKTKVKIGKRRQNEYWHTACLFYCFWDLPQSLARFLVNSRGVFFPEQGLHAGADPRVEMAETLAPGQSVPPLGKLPSVGLGEIGFDFGPGLAFEGRQAGFSQPLAHLALVAAGA